MPSTSSSNATQHGPAVPDDERAATPLQPSPPAVFFVHVMKTGGTTLFEYLRDRYSPKELWPNPNLDLRFDGSRLDVRHHLSVSYLAGLSEERRRQIRVYSGHLPYAAHEVLGPDVAMVTVLRDPVERTISLLRQFRRSTPGLQDPDRPRPLADATLEQVYAHPAVFAPLVLNHQTKIFSMRATDHPESYLDLVHVDDARLESAKASLATVDVVGVMERYDDFLDALEAKFGWAVGRESHANATPATDHEPVSDALREQIAADNAIDIEFYEHAKQLVRLRQDQPSAEPTRDLV